MAAAGAAAAVAGAAARGKFTPETAAEPAVAHEGNGAAAPEPADGESEGGGEQRGEHDGGRRRRRGRRGGRRNRRGREGEGFAAQNGNGEHHDRQPHEQHGVEPEVADAVADLGGPGQAEAPAEPAQAAPQPFEPVAREPEPLGTSA